MFAQIQVIKSISFYINILWIKKITMTKKTNTKKNSFVNLKSKSSYLLSEVKWSEVKLSEVYVHKRLTGNNIFQIWTCTWSDTCLFVPASRAVHHTYRLPHSIYLDFQTKIQVPSVWSWTVQYEKSLKGELLSNLCLFICEFVLFRM